MAKRKPKAECKLPGHLPDCLLLRTLIDRVAGQADLGFDFPGQLDAFRSTVAGEVKYTALTFPEFTPHDEEHHLTRLLHFADRLLGAELIGRMNVSELFVLAVGIYGHDWGMAVGPDEKAFILTGALPEDSTANDFATLIDEEKRWSKFARDHGLVPDEDGRYIDVPDELWREYVRLTHAFRSGRRVRKYFEPIDGGVADAGQRVCEGHWLDIEQIEDHTRYRTEFPVHGRPINLRALAIYVRLIDLLDISEDRTPYIIWKFVAPRDENSQMEWSKHRALRPVAIPESRDYLVVEGSTDDHEVYAALDDLRLWCLEQFRSSIGSLARLHDPIHKLGPSDIQWHVEAVGFNPILIRFEFNRDSMFDILSDEIYQGDHYVFLRELLQNSIDAIRLRRELLQRKGEDPGAKGVIHVKVDHKPNGDAIISFCDDGIGMDDHVVRDYLAVAGRSYYQSDEFRRQGLQLDPISRFGIGILSCFLPATKIEIDTYRVPLLSPGANPLKARIPAFRRNFRIEPGDPHAASVGTTVTVFVEGARIADDAVDASPAAGDKPATPRQLRVTEYLCEVAGFVEFPIVVTEGDHRTVILHPKHNRENAQQRFGKEFSVHQLDCAYRWEQKFLPQDLSFARELLEETRLDVEHDLQVQGAEGVFSCVVPKEGVHISYYSYKSIKASLDPQPEHEVRYVGFERSTELPGLAPSSHADEFVRVYRDGVLLSTTSTGNQFQLAGGYREFPGCTLMLNFVRSPEMQVDVSRKELRRGGGWESHVQAAVIEWLTREELPNALKLHGKARAIKLLELVRHHSFPLKTLLELMTVDEWPVFTIEADGTLSTTTWDTVVGTPFFAAPRGMEEMISPLAINSFKHSSDTGKDVGQILDWEGDRFFADGVYSGRDSLSDMIGELVTVARDQTHVLESVRFLDGATPSDAVILQQKFVPRDTSEPPHRNDLFRKVAESPTDLSLNELAALNAFNARLHYRDEVSFFFGTVTFSAPFQDAFAYGRFTLNYRHPIAQRLLMINAKVIVERLDESLADHTFGEFNDALENAAVSSHTYGTFYFPEISAGLERLWSLACKMGWIDSSEAILPDKSEFLRDFYHVRGKVEGPFGRPLADLP